ncbi:aldo/keto reductase [Paucilactobacillus kaifaensis]|uniref:aldo/keto reductase n=1 Tax=Paucilactobacillus kaifaensis TaxID=2559921 RepID=UPI0010F71C69|nr:aldo/keto reductase [Paucilactobacillus kaifaensis]
MKNVLIANQTVPAIGIGTWNMGETPALHDQEVKSIQTSLQAGVKLIDTAEMYGNGKSELLVHDAIQGFNRSDLLIVDKVLPQNATNTRMEHSLNQSLHRLDTDYIDLYLYHWRGTTPLAETINELERLQQTGKIRRWGVSNFDTIDMRELMQLNGGKNAATNQVMYNLNHRGIEFDLLNWMNQHQLPTMAYSPVAHGDKLGRSLSHNRDLIAIANNHHVSVMQLILGWTIQQPNIIAIPKTSNPQHANENVAAGEITLSADELEQINLLFPAPTTKQPLSIL